MAVVPRAAPFTGTCPCEAPAPLYAADPNPFTAISVAAPVPVVTEIVPFAVPETTLRTAFVARVPCAAVA